MTSILAKRRAGILLHITSLPGSGQVGDLGPDAYRFVRFLHDCGASVWQTLPLGLTHADRSPYQSLSAHAGNPELINTEWIIRQGWLSEAGNESASAMPVEPSLTAWFYSAFQGFQASASQTEKQHYKKFCRDKSYWLDDFALFMALRCEFKEQAWNTWPDDLKNRDPKALQKAKKRLKTDIDSTKFQQYVFFRQWLELKAYAGQHGILMFGDIPIFVSYDSADVWANREVFKLDDNGAMTVVAGVPPDYFSETGQRWGNPHFNWDYLEHSGFRWWLDRLKTQLELFDILRIDHFRGLEAAWEIPSSEPTAIVGNWVKAPGSALLRAFQAEFGEIPLVAEDLGIITPEVEALRDEFKLPGMKILQFAFGDTVDNPYLPRHHVDNCVVYTGTHDNDTTLGWADKLNDEEKWKVYDFLGHPEASINWALIQAAFGSVANLAIIPLQDFLELGGEHRMNTPGTTAGNWMWRFGWDQVSPEKSQRLRQLIKATGR